MQGVVFSLVHAVLLLVISFFVLLSARKSDSRNIKIFGYVIVALLWVAAALILGKGLMDRRFHTRRMCLAGEKMPHLMMPEQIQQSTREQTPAK